MPDSPSDVSPANGSTIDDSFDENFKPRGTVAIVAMFVAMLILLWLSIYLILIARGVTL